MFDAAAERVTFVGEAHRHKNQAARRGRDDEELRSRYLVDVIRQERAPRLMDQIFTSSNPLVSWLRQLDGLRKPRKERMAQTISRQRLNVPAPPE